jgi:hypothetical protein
MKRLYPLLLFMAALACMPAKADSLTISLDSSTLSGSPGSEVEFFGTLTNNTGADLFLNADSFNLAGFDPSAIDDSPFFTNAPLFLAPGANTGDIGLFNITIPDPFATNSYPGSFQILGGATEDDQTVIGTADFVVNVQPVSAVPEPSSLSMLGLAATLLFLFRVRGHNLLRG